MRKIRNYIFWIVGLVLLIMLIYQPVYFPFQNESWHSVALPLSGKVIVLDPGHGGPDGGASGKDQVRTQEKDITLAVAKLVRKYVEHAGGIVYLTREEDVDLADEDLKGLSKRKSQDIRRRLQFIHDKNADFFITIHLNALPSTRWSGAQTFYYSRFEESKFLATLIQAEIIRNLENTTRAPLEINHVYLLKHAEVPGALVEIGFLSNEAEREKLKQKQYQEKMALSIYQGILRYVTEEQAE